MKEEKRVEVIAKPSEVYEYLCDPKNYLGSFSEVTIGKDGKSATAEIPFPSRSYQHVTTRPDRTDGVWEHGRESDVYF